MPPGAVTLCGPPHHPGARSEIHWARSEIHSPCRPCPPPPPPCARACCLELVSPRASLGCLRAATSPVARATRVPRERLATRVPREPCAQGLLPLPPGPPLSVSALHPPRVHSLAARAAQPSHLVKVRGRPEVSHAPGPGTPTRARAPCRSHCMCGPPTWPQGDCARHYCTGGQHCSAAVPRPHHTATCRAREHVRMHSLTPAPGASATTALPAALPSQIGVISYYDPSSPVVASDRNGGWLKTRATRLLPRMSGCACVVGAFAIPNQYGDAVARMRMRMRSHMRGVVSFMLPRLPPLPGSAPTLVPRCALLRLT